MDGFVSYFFFKSWKGSGVLETGLEVSACLVEDLFEE